MSTQHYFEWKIFAGCLISNWIAGIFPVLNSCRLQRPSIYLATLDDCFLEVIFKFLFNHRPKKQEKRESEFHEWWQRVGKTFFSFFPKNHLRTADKELMVAIFLSLQANGGCAQDSDFQVDFYWNVNTFRISFHFIDAFLGFIYSVGWLAFSRLLASLNSISKKRFLSTSRDFIFN